MEQKLGRTLSNKAVALAVHQSRAKKIKGISTTEVRERQLGQLQPDELQALQKLSASVQPVLQVLRFEPENQALNYAVAHGFERKSVVPEHELSRHCIPVIGLPTGSARINNGHPSFAAWQ